MKKRLPPLLALLFAMLGTGLNAADLLVAMSGGGTVERYDFATGRHVLPPGKDIEEMIGRYAPLESHAKG